MQSEFLRYLAPWGSSSRSLLRYSGSLPTHVSQGRTQPMRPLQSLTLEAMIDTVSTTFGAIPDPRRPDRVDYSLHDTLLSGFAMMVFQHPQSFGIPAQNATTSGALQPRNHLWSVAGALRHSDARHLGWCPSRTAAPLAAHVF